MALPGVEDTLMQLVAEEEQELKRQEALAKVNGGAATEAKAEAKAEPEAKAEVKAEVKAEPEAKAEVKAEPEAKAEVKAEPEAEAKAEAEPVAEAKVETAAEAKAEPEAKVETAAEAKAEPEAKAEEQLPATAAGQALATAAQVGAVNSMAFLEELGIAGIKLDFTSFPTVTLNNHVFSTDEHKAFGTEFEFVYMDKRETVLVKADRGRDKDPILVYTDDGLYDNKADEDGNRKPIAQWIEEWKLDPEVLGVEKKPYTMVICSMVSEPHEGEIVQLQISPASQGKLGGYLYGLGYSKTDPKTVVTKASIGAEVGSGTKAFTPWVFKKVKK